MASVKRGGKAQGGKEVPEAARPRTTPAAVSDKAKGDGGSAWGKAQGTGSRPVAASPSSSSSAKAKAAPKTPVNIAALAARNLGGFVPNKIFVGGVPITCTEEQFKSYFEPFGPISKVELHALRGFGYITYESVESVDSCLEKYDDHFLCKKWVEVKRSIPRELIDSYEREQKRLLAEHMASKEGERISAGTDGPGKGDGTPTAVSHHGPATNKDSNRTVLPPAPTQAAVGLPPASAWGAKGKGSQQRSMDEGKGKASTGDHGNSVGPGSAEPYAPGPALPAPGGSPWGGAGGGKGGGSKSGEVSRIAQLKEMGFSEQVAKRVLSECAWDVNRAIDKLLTSGVAPEDMSASGPPPPPSAAATEDAFGMQQSEVAAAPLQRPTEQASSENITTGIASLLVEDGSANGEQSPPRQPPPPAPADQPGVAAASPWKERDEGTHSPAAAPATADGSRTEESVQRFGQHEAPLQPQPQTQNHAPTHPEPTGEAAAFATFIKRGDFGGEAAKHLGEAAATQDTAPSAAPEQAAAAPPRKRIERAARSWAAEDPSQLTVDEGEYVKVWIDHQTDHGWIHAEGKIGQKVDSNPIGWLPLCVLKTLPDGQRWMSCNQSWQAMDESQCRVEEGGLVVVWVASRTQEGWAYVEAEIEGGATKPGWLPVFCLEWNED